ncbi:MAG: hypothetical protein IKE58_10195 [Blautia sp.]|nr:hypothetical protein [Blautia sp.]
MKMNRRNSRIVSIYKQFKSELAGHMELTIAQAGKVMEDLYDALDALVWEREYDDDIDYCMKNDELLHFDIVKCVESGDGFIEGHYYAQVGWNNGISICLLTETGDCEVHILLYHELLHVGVNERSGEMVYVVNPHDVEDFRTIIDRYGIDWAKAVS